MNHFGKNKKMKMMIAFILEDGKIENSLKVNLYFSEVPVQLEFLLI